MAENGDKKARGMDRREFIRRSAIVGGTVAWMTPVIQSLTPPAYAHVVSDAFTCCQCVSNSTGLPTSCHPGETAVNCAKTTGTRPCTGATTGVFHGGPNAFTCAGNACVGAPGHTP